MQTLIILFMFSISFLPLALSGLPPLIRLPTKADLSGISSVLDTDGNPVVPGAQYYVVPATIGVVGGVSVAKSNQGNPSTCPTDVILNISVVGIQPPAVGRPITFYPLQNEASDGAATAIQDSYPLNVAFHAPDTSDPCAKETVWKLDVLADEPVIVTGGVIGNKEDITNWFRIAKNGNGRGYVFTFWPSLCLGCRIRTWGIGTVGEGYQLGINDNSRAAFKFVRAG